MYTYVSTLINPPCESRSTTGRLGKILKGVRKITIFRVPCIYFLLVDVFNGDKAILDPDGVCHGLAGPGLRQHEPLRYSHI